MGDENKFEAKEVVDKIQKEIDSLGENNKKSFDELNSQYEDLKKELKDLEGKDSDAVIEDKIKKITSDIVTRQDDLDKKAAVAADEAKETEEKINKIVTDEAKKMQERMDEIETALNRSAEGEDNLSSKEAKELKAEALTFYKDALVVRDTTGKGATHQRVEQMEKDGISTEDFTNYRKSFANFLRVNKEFVTMEEAKALQVGIDPDGGYTVTPAVSRRIVKRIFESDPIRQMSGRQTISTGTLDMRVDFGQAGWGWEGETESGDETSTPDFRKKSIPVHVMYAKPQATQTLLEDSGINIENWLADKVAEVFMRGEGASFVTGDGVGKPRGFLTYDNYATAGEDEYGAIERTNMGHATQFTADGLIGVKYSLTEHFLNRGTWVTQRSSIPAIMKLKDGNGNYLWSPGLAEDKTSQILGLPVRMSATMPTVAAGALAIALADWKQAYLVVDRLGITVRRDPYTQIPFIMFYTRRRVGGDVVNYQAIKIGVIAA